MAAVFVYVIAHRNSDAWAGPCKLGISRTPNVRLNSLQSGNPRPIGVYASVKCPARESAGEVEAYLHFAMKDRNLLGEWFAVEPEYALQLVSLSVASAIAASGYSPDDALSYTLSATKRAISACLDGRSR